MRTSKVRALTKRDQVMSGESLREELDKARAETNALRTCLLAIAKQQGRIRMSQHELDQIDEAHDVVSVRVDGAFTIVEYERRG